MADETFDVTIIGSGPGGYVSAIKAGQLGLKTALIEKDANLGGTCTLRGCIPTKSLLHAAWLYDQFKKADKIGIIAREIGLDFALVQNDKNKVVDKLSKGISYLMKKNKVQVFNGTGGIAGPGKVSVGGQVLNTRYIVLATGSTVRWLPGLSPVPGRILSSDELLEIEHVPKSMAVLGAGAVGVEFASVFSRFGAEMHLVEMLPRIVPLEDEEVSKELERVFKKAGINIYTDHKAGDFKVESDGVQFTATSSSGKAVTLKVETLLVAVGRAPVSNIPGLDQTKVQLDRGFIKVDEGWQTAEPGVYAIGDVIMLPGGKHPQLAHMASAEGIRLMQKLAGGNPPPINYDRVPNATYCDPEVASVGLTEAEARKRGYDVKVGKFPFTALSKATIEHDNTGFVKMVSEAKYDELLGVHIIGPQATNLLSEACLGMQLETTTEEVGWTIHPHPTLSEIIPETAHAVEGHTIHI
ncbi:MAG: dihydrolipoyl dehydrogenase [Candidatus Xenobia bacterium]